MNTAARALLLVLLAAAISCRKKKDHDDAPPGPAVYETIAPAGSAPPILFNLNVGFSENASLAQLQAIHAKFVTANQSLWNVTEGQVRINHLRIRDNAAPGSMSQQYASIDSSTLDVMVWPVANFNGPGAGYVVVVLGPPPPQIGRAQRFMGLPENFPNTTLIHELGHFAFQLSWGVGPLLVDEYSSAPQDVGCAMDLSFTPLRWCAADNHQAQASQPTSCWQQILIDYPSFAYAGTNTAPSLPPDPTVEYTDVP